MKPIWTDASPSLPTNKEDNAAALTDASTAVPLDLLSSGPASEEEVVNEKTSKKTNNKDRSKSKPRRRDPNEESMPESLQTVESKEEKGNKIYSRPRNFRKHWSIKYHKDSRRTNCLSGDNRSS